MGAVLERWQMEEDETKKNQKQRQGKEYLRWRVSLTAGRGKWRESRPVADLTCHKSLTVFCMGSVDRTTLVCTEQLRN